ncbi:uncharacterized protein LOC129752175 [Uranotaenia lowii]|uniref:uncharacterized protein LOC129752175 n=1 Tax=Uranotaenia lowii TaxID=190385 RepID=UPI00247A0D3E|nr:uncharacterized protein LOC129752175 [Uranotaenia lowii]
MVNRRLMTELEEKHLLDNRQHAFRKGRGTSSYFCELDEKIQKAAEQHMHVEFVTLDIAKAYDRTWRHNILQHLNRWGIDGRMFSFIHDFLTGRMFRVVVGGTKSSRRCLENGVPQGSVLSVTLFLVAMQSIFDHVPEGIEILLYADDILVISTGPFASSVRKRLQKAIDIINSWAHNIGFQVSAEKSQLMHSCYRKHHGKAPPALQVSENTINKANCIKLLGVWIDKRLNFKKHINITKKDASKRLCLLRCISGRSKIGCRKTIASIGKSLIVPKITYGIEIVSRSGLEVFSRLTPTYNSIFRFASGAMPSSPIPSLMAEAGVLPFDLVAIEIFARCAMRFQQKAMEPTTTFSRASTWFENVVECKLPNIQNTSGLRQRRWNTPKPEIDWGIKKLVSAGENSNKTRVIFASHVDQKYKRHQHIYTDGSVRDGSVGLGVTSKEVEICLKLPESCSIFSAEAAAINHAIEIAEQSGKPTVIFSDSASCLSAIEGGSNPHPWIRRAENRCIENSIAVCWIPSHCGIVGNHKADFLADKGRTSFPMDNVIPYQDAHRWVHTLLRRHWEQEWINRNTSHLRKIKTNTFNWIDRKQRLEQRCLTRLRIGHTRITHSFLMERKDRPICEECQTILDVEHILLTCPKYQIERRRLGLDSSLKSILARDTNKETKVIEFLKSINLYDKI